MSDSLIKVYSRSAWDFISFVPVPPASAALLLDPGGPLSSAARSTVIAAYSTRKLLTAYTSANGAMSVTTSQAGNATQNIGFTGTNDLDTTSLASFIGSNTGTVNTWYDQSGNGTNATQATISVQPVIVSSGTLQTQGGKAVLNWIAASANLLFTVTQAQPVTFAILFKLNSLANIGSGHLTDGSGATRALFGTSAGSQYTAFAGTNVLTGGTLDTNAAAHTNISIFNDTSSSFLIDGSQVISGSPTTPGTQGLGGGTLIGAGNGPTGCMGNIGEFIVFSSVLSAADYGAIRTNWQSYWGAS